ncbi:hypothetical protein A9Q86_11240 [Flavobacteriales bacterium 33_180_T64]|nr:hypothetical protein A9Q86_11240 [Flavobacteriales bacterium 33_180_T64]
MRKLAFIIASILTLVFLSCDRRTSKKEHLEHAILEFNKKMNTANVNTYYPERYTEIKIDSIISNTFKVSINNYVSSNAKILIKESVKNLKKTSEFHRAFESDILVSVENKIILKTHISAENFIDNSSSHFWKNATLEHVWVNQETSNKNKLSLGISFINPKNDSFMLYEMRIDKKGNKRLTLIEDQS